MKKTTVIRLIDQVSRLRGELHLILCHTFELSAREASELIDRIEAGQTTLAAELDQLSDNQAVSSPTTPQLADVAVVHN